MTTRRTDDSADRHAALTDAVSRPEADWVDDHGREIEDHDRGLLFDLGTMNRRRALGLIGGVGALAALAACGTTTGSTSTGTSSSSSSGSASSGSSSSSSADGTLTEVPDETAGPYPGDGSNGANVLDDSGIVRSDIRSSFGSSTTTAPTATPPSPTPCPGPRPIGSTATAPTSGPTTKSGRTMTAVCSSTWAR